MDRYRPIRIAVAVFLFLIYLIILQMPMKRLKNRITDMDTYLREHPIAISEYDEKLIRRLIEKVTIYEDKFIVDLNPA